MGCSMAAWRRQNSPAPRASATAYPVSKVQPVYSIGAKRLSKTEVSDSFGILLAGRYIVVEVGFYPADSKTLGLKQSHFALIPPTVPTWLVRRALARLPPFTRSGLGVAVM